MLRKVVTFMAIGCVLGFDSHTFLQNTRSDGGDALNFTIPGEVDPADPYALLNEAASINEQVEALFAQIDEYTTHFNNATGPEVVEINKFETEITRAQNDLITIKNTLEALQNVSDALIDEEKAYQSQLTCLAKSECHPIPVTTTLAPAPEYNCSLNPDNFNRAVTGANQTGTIKFPIRYNFDSCKITLTSTQLTGLYYDFTVTDFGAYGSSILVETESGSNFTINDNGVYGNNTDYEYTFTLNGNLRFTLQYTTRDMCANHDCANGHCVVDKTTNKQKCVCDGCYQLGPTAKCTIPKPSPCIANGAACTATGGICAADNACQYYCVCPGVDSTCQTNKWCDGTCQPPRKFGAVQPQKKWWYWF